LASIISLAASLAPATMARLGSIDERFQSSNIDCPRWKAIRSHPGVLI
jgi:hypothetical protein